MYKEIENGGVTAAKGFMAASTAAGIKYSDREDMALIFSETPADCAGTFTSNVVKAAPVKWDAAIIDNGCKVSAVVINAGIANAATGPEGFRCCMETARVASDALSVDETSIAVASTGVIGKTLPMDRISQGINTMAKELSGDIEAGTKASKAIMTTDTYNKECAVTFDCHGKTVTIGGMAKGSGMIHPNMCTMLSFVTTDAVISRQLLQEAISEVVKDSYNMISVDGDTSTNDTCLVLANGAAGNAMINKADGSYDDFLLALSYVNMKLARLMAKDGEGATKLIEVCVKSAASRRDARKLAKSVVSSSLVKAAVFGRDANWGRILCALGYSGVDFDPTHVNISVASGGKSLMLAKNGLGFFGSDGCNFETEEEFEKEATNLLSADEIEIYVDMNAGLEEAIAYGCDLTYDYVKINADYRS